ncbi:GtrA family protein [Cohnella panacarvi]|uniref:GtrA family protein n=1 Tax=Cohnella panacarvi TaxID=400776 RepID=UPI00047E3CD4|nr:GtrA family protein [Cohnella panacarvi]
MLKRSEMTRMAKYALVGVMNTGVDFAVFCVLVYAAGLGSAWAQPVSYGTAIANSYVLNRVWTFQVRKRQRFGDIVKFIAVNALSFAAATAALLGLEQAGFEAAIAKACSVGVSLVVNYFGYKFWVFRGEKRAG